MFFFTYFYLHTVLFRIFWDAASSLVLTFIQNVTEFISGKQIGYFCIYGFLLLIYIRLFAGVEEDRMLGPKVSCLFQ